MNLAGKRMLAQRIANLHRDTACILLLCMFGAAIRLAALAALGPIDHIDSDGYIVFADLILNQSDWRHHADLTKFPIRAPTLRPDIGDPSVITTVRLIGYPAVLALAKSIAPDGFRYMVCLWQIALSLVTHSLLFTAARRMTVPRAIALPSVLLFSLSFPLLYDISILSDSMFNNLIIIVSSIIILNAFGNRNQNIIYSIIGVLLLLCVILRDVGIYFVFIFFVLFMSCDYFRTRRLIRLWLPGALLIVPSLIATEGIKTWNAERTGERFTTIISGTMLRPAVALELSGTPALAGKQKFRQALEETIGFETEFGPCARAPLPKFFDIRGNKRLHSLAHACMDAMHQRLLTIYRMNNFQIAAAAKSTLVHMALNHPLQFTRYILSEMLPQMPAGIVTFDQIVAVATGGDFTRQISLNTQLRTLKNKPIDFLTVAIILIEVSSRLVSALLFAAFFLLLPIIVVMSIGRQNSITPPVARSLTVHFVIAAALLVGYSLVHIEPRYFMAAQAFILLDGTFAIAIVAKLIADRRQVNAGN